MTNGDRIRAMSDEELSKFLNKIARMCIREIDNCELCPIFECCAMDIAYQQKWLKKEVHENATNQNPETSY